MMTKHAILIGVNTIPGLGYLSSPSSYAIKMKNWALSQGYTTHLFVDEPGDESVSGRCKRSDILDVSMEIIDQGCDQLLIYFAGHGVELTAGDDVWLLPGYIDDSGDCISIFSCQQRAYHTGIQHVVFISDACRSPSDNPLIRAITPNPLLPNRNNTSHRTVVDIFYSTWPGEDSRDIRNEETGNYHSHYSDSLLECLHGSVDEVIKEIVNITPGFPAVLSFELNNYLKKRVPEKIRIAGGKVQFPMGAVSSSDPLFLSKFDTESGEQRNTETGLSTIVETEYRGIDKRTIDQKLSTFAKIKGGNVRAQINKIKRDFKKDYLIFTSPDIFREKTGIFVTGIDNPIIFSRRESDWYFPERDWLKERMDFSSIQTLDFENVGPGGGVVYFVANGRRKRFYPINVLYGYLTQIVFEKDELLTVNYFPTSGDGKHEAHRFASEIAERKAHIILAAKSGIFQGTHELGDYLRKYKHLDPTLGLFAAYAYFQKGDFQGVNEVYDILERDGQSILGDLGLLKNLSTSENYLDDGNEIQIPLITEGWSYLNLLDQNPYSSLTQYLQPGLWTSFDRAGIDIIRNQYNFNEI